MSAAARLPRRAWLMLIVVGFLGFCAVLRAPVGVIPPLLTRLGWDLGMGEVARGALTSVPILCFGLLTPVASLVVRRLGVNTAGLLTLGMALVGALLRSAGTTWAAFAGTVIIGAGLTVGNLVAPMVIGRDFWHRTALMTGLYSSTCNVIVTAATALAVPLALVIGWQGSAAAWTAVPVLLAGAMWLWVFPPGSQTPRQSLRERSGMSSWVTERALVRPTSSTGTAVWRRPLTWVMAVAFAALFTLVIRRSESVDENRRTTAVIQTTGYCVAAVGPVVMGWVHERSGGWVAPFAMVTGVLVLMTVCAQIVARTGEPSRAERVIPTSVLEDDEQTSAQGGAA